MTFIEKLNVIERVDQLIRMKASGTSEELAKRLGVSRSTVFEILNCMKAMGAEIEYNEARKCYCYKAEKELVIGFVHQKEVIGGKNGIEFCESDFFGLMTYKFEFES